MLSLASTAASESPEAAAPWFYGGQTWGERRTCICFSLSLSVYPRIAPRARHFLVCVCVCVCHFCTTASEPSFSSWDLKRETCGLVSSITPPLCVSPFCPSVSRLCVPHRDTSHCRPQVSHMDWSVHCRPCRTKTTAPNRLFRSYLLSISSSIRGRSGRVLPLSFFFSVSGVVVRVHVSTCAYCGSHALALDWTQTPPDPGVDERWVLLQSTREPNNLLQLYHMCCQ